MSQLDELDTAVRRQIELLSTPVNLAQLESDGVIRKVGAAYEVISPAALPNHLSARIKSTRMVGAKMRITLMSDAEISKAINADKRHGR